MKVIIPGSSGMVGSLVLAECLTSPDIEHVISIVRKPTGRKHEKLKEIIHADFSNYANLSSEFEGAIAVYFCIGIYTGTVTDEIFKQATIDYPVNLAKIVKECSPQTRFCLLSGAGADRTEKSRTAFARYKGMAENQIDNTGIEFYSLRPGYIYPVTKRKEPNFMYRLSRRLYPIIQLFGKNASIKSTELAKAMFNIGLNGAKKQILENRDILNYI